MTLREDVFDRCTGFAGVAALIGTRCYPDMLTENPTYPALVFHAPISDDDSGYRTHDDTPVPRTVSRVQFDVYGATGDDSAALADQLRLAWSGYGDGCNIGYAFIANLITDGWNDNLKNYRHIMDVMVEHPIVA